MADIGATLREARMRARIDISEVETRTKIRAKYLRAIENEEWDLLPGPVYIKSFLRTYGDYLGLDSRMLIDEYKRRYERPSDHDMRPIASLGRERERAARGPMLPSWAVIGGVLLVLVVALYIVGRGANSPSSTPSTGARANNGQARSSHKRAKPVPAVAARPTSVTLKLVPTGQVWVCLVDGTGKKLINGQTLSAGQSVPAHTASKLLLNIGNAAVKLNANGRDVVVPPSNSAIGYLFGPTGHRSLAVGKRPTCA
jgi:cytoskeletal protein RodZ